MLLAFLFGLFLRCLVSLHGFSGFGKPPLFGDFEAQRHWMEISINIPPRDWYLNSTENPQEHWGLDYPPLSGGNYINPSWFALQTSWGKEDQELIFFMRTTVILIDLFFFLPVLFLTAAKLHPSYNNVMLSFVLLSIYFFSQQAYVKGAICFSLSLCFKQMSLYFALPIFFYLLRLSLR
ncbi:ALG6, ALG8 glycosyltransferase, partial [Rozella allomycis CSF55]